jgi:hypothetical protein
MSIYSKSSTAIKHDDEAQQKATIIPWPKVGDFIKEKEEKETKRIRLDQKFLYYKGKKIPILQFQKSGYDKLLKLLVKEIRG